MIFSKIIFVDFIFLILSWLEFSFVIFLKNTVGCYNISLHGFFCYDFFQNCICRFYFFNIELVENYYYNKAKIMWENTIVIHSILKEKKLQSKIFNQLNIKKIKSTKIILKKINKKKRKSWKKKKVILKKKTKKN